MQDFHQLKVWEKAHALTLDIYRITRDFPRAENFGLQSQMRRASVSVGANIAEGSGRSSRGEFGQFLSQALGSATELEYFVLLARDLDLIDGSTQANVGGRVVELKRMLTALLRWVRVPLPKRTRGSSSAN
jgi:four helix bundle protein